MTDVIVIGGGIAGLTAALYILRAGKTVRVLEERVFGGQIVDSPQVENYPGLSQVSGVDFANALLEQVVRLGGKTESEKAVGIQREEGFRRVITDVGNYSAKTIILATGARHRKLQVEGEERLAGKGVSYCAICDGAFFKGKDTAVVGGGSAALQSALQLSSICRTVYLIHRRDTFRAEKALIKQVQQARNIIPLMEKRIISLSGEKSLTSLMMENTKNGARKELVLQGLFISIGQVPANQAFASAVHLDSNGYIEAGEDCCVSDPRLFVAGDCRTKNVRQLTTAAADGTVAALAACRAVDAADRIHN